MALFSENSEHYPQRLAEVLVKQGFDVNVYDTYEKMVELVKLGAQLPIDVAAIHLGFFMSGEKGIFLRDDVVKYALPEETRRVFIGNHPVGEIKDEVIQSSGDHYVNVFDLYKDKGVKILLKGKISKEERESRGVSFTGEEGLRFEMESHLKTNEREQGDGDRDGRYWLE